MKKLLYYVIPITFLLPTMAYAVDAYLDATKTIQDHAMLIILFCLFLFAVGKYLWDKLVAKLEEQQIENKIQEDKTWTAELKLKEQEISQLKERLDRVEVEQNSCSKGLPIIYVTRSEYDKFTEIHRTDINGITLKLEGMMKELRIEIKEDLQENINRIISVLNEVIKK